MKATTLILVFSGLISLNRCSSDVKIGLPKFSIDKNLNLKEFLKPKSENIKDTLSTSSFFLPIIKLYRVFNSWNLRFILAFLNQYTICNRKLSSLR